MKILALDMDGTVRVNRTADLNNLSLPSGFIQSPEDQKIIPAAARAIKHYAAQGWFIVGASNQGGVAANKKTLQSCIEEQEYTLNLIPQLLGILFCPDYEGKRCWEINRKAHIPRIECYEEDEHKTLQYAVNTSIQRFPSNEIIGKCRKPEAGMLKLAITILAGNSDCEILFVGDRPEDQQAAANAHIPFLWAKDWWM